MDISYITHTLVRSNPRTGYTERVVYTGNIKNKPKGWKVEKKKWATVTTDEHGLTGKHY